MGDICKPLKMEDTTTGSNTDFGPTEMNPTEDYAGIAGVALRASLDHTIDRDESNNIVFKDPIAGAVTLNDLKQTGTGISEASHKLLDQLVHSISENNHEDITWDGWKKTSIINWTDNNKTIKIRECNLTYTGWKVSTIVIKQYDGVGTLLTTLTGTFTWNGWKVDFIDWVLS